MIGPTVNHCLVEETDELYAAERLAFTMETIRGLQELANSKPDRQVMWLAGPGFALIQDTE